MRRFLLVTAFICGALPQVQAGELQDILQIHAEEVAKPSRRSVGALLDDLVTSGLPQVPVFLEEWSAKNVWQSPDGQFVFAVPDGDTLEIRDVDTGDIAAVPKDGYDQIRPNGGVRRTIGTALVQFQLSDPDPVRRQSALEAISRRPEAAQLAPLQASVGTETDPALRAQKEQLVVFMSARFADTSRDRIAAINSLAEDTSVEARGVLNSILSTEEGVASELPDANIARVIDPAGAPDAFYEKLVEEGLAPPVVTEAAIRSALEQNVSGGAVGGVPTARLNTTDARHKAYEQLAADGLVPPLITVADRDAALAAHVFFEVYDEKDPAVTAAAADALATVTQRVSWEQAADLGLDALSLASIYFLAAIGLAITFGVMGVINMAHGEFIMMGAYTGYVVQLFVPDYTLSIIIALPLAFAVTFGAGVTMERLVIRHLYHRPLETLLATFGISIALQQLAKNIFGTQARPLTSPGWLDGAWIISDVIQISYIRIAIFVLALMFLALILFILKRTRLGLEVRAVTQNPGMAASMGINPDRINMLTFGLGSGIAGIAGVAIGLYAKVTSEMGADYIVQSFMTVVVGGVGNVWGTLAGASMIGFLQKGIEWLNPSNTLAAQTYMILFIILFIQFRPRGIVALKGRAAAD
ncbi:urea ABC transporter permease subunit UrtB [uncultured Roseobacter sp.]|uniref:urea ABC transporter permease subunit UrtB n=1 Tax=uncultured Roseobacter sp. TaxID=114847 RepID=UPI0026280C8C|nr:urea ABC transporter permease subunit UrtB [uncultured Roseobacter sp.]